MKQLGVMVVFAMVAAIVPVGADAVQAADTSPPMKQVLLNPKGFDMTWTCNASYGATIDGRSHIVFRQDGDTIAVEINSYMHGGCNSQAVLTDNTVMFDGCHIASHYTTLSYDPGNKKTPFKGTGWDCPRVELSPR
jgi:hypothetical protein